MLIKQYYYDNEAMMALLPGEVDNNHGAWDH